MNRHRFEAYLDKVFGFSALVSALPEGRQFPQHAWKKVFDAVFLGAAMQIPSLLQIEAECHHGALAKRIGPVSVRIPAMWIVDSSAMWIACSGDENKVGAKLRWDCNHA